jgi:hypothetical protein
LINVTGVLNSMFLANFMAGTSKGKGLVLSISRRNDARYDMAKLLDDFSIALQGSKMSCDV